MKHWVPLFLIRPVLLKSKRREHIRNSKKEAVWGHWDRCTYVWSKIEADEGHWCRVPFFLNWSIGFPFLWSDQYYSDQKEGNILETAKKEAVWGHWEVIGIGGPIFDQKLRPIAAEEVIKILFPCFWSDAINSCENPKSKKYKKKSETLRHPSTSIVSSWLKSTADC